MMAVDLVRHSSIRVCTKLGSGSRGPLTVLCLSGSEVEHRRGVEVLPEGAGIFPKVEQRIAEEDRRPLEMNHETFVNYVSIEDPEFGLRFWPNLLTRGLSMSTAPSTRHVLP